MPEERKDGDNIKENLNDKSKSSKTKEEVEIDEGKTSMERNCDELEKEIKELREKLAKTEEAAKNLSVIYQRLEKEFEDYKIRVRREKEEAKDEGALRILNGFIEIVDNFEKALESAKNATDITAFIKGVQMIHYQLNKFLQEHGVEKVRSEGEFNPQEHEAIEKLETDQHMPNSIVKVIQTGYKYKGKVIRPAKVIVAVEKEKEEGKDR